MPCRRSIAVIIFCCCCCVIAAKGTSHDAPFAVQRGLKKKKSTKGLKSSPDSIVNSTATPSTSIAPTPGSSKKTSSKDKKSKKDKKKKGKKRHSSSSESSSDTSDSSDSSSESSDNSSSSSGEKSDYNDHVRQLLHMFDLFDFRFRFELAIQEEGKEATREVVVTAKQAT